MNLKNCIISAFLLIFTAGPLSAQWKPAGYLTTGMDTAHKVYTIKNFGQNTYLGTDVGLFVILPTGVTTIMSLKDHNIKSIFVDSAGDIFAASDSMISYSTDQGATFNTATDGGFRSIHGLFGKQVNGKPHLFVAYGDNSKKGVSYSDDFFTTYSPTTNLSSPAYDFVQLGNVILVGAQDGIYRLNDDAISWRGAGTGFPGGTIFGTLATAGGNIYAADWLRNGLYISRDSAKTWQAANSTVFHDSCAVSSIAGNKDTVLAVAMGDCADNNHAIKASGDGGRSWLTYMVGLDKGNYTQVGYNSGTGCFYTFNEANNQMYEACNVSTGIGNPIPSAIEFTIYPNPAENSIRIHISQFHSGMKGTIMNFLGEKISTFPLYQAETTLLVSDLNSGVYFIKVESSANTGVMKFVKN